jgi:hypothetical protein
VRVLRFQIRQPNGQIDQLFIESERVSIGSGAHCEIRLPLDQAAVEHALVQVGPAGVFVQALAFQPPPTVNNVPFQQGPLPADAVLGIGQIQINVALVDAAQKPGGDVIRKKQGGASPVALIALVGILGGGYFVMFGDAGVAEVKAAPHEPPELWGPVVEACPQPTPERALADARARNGLADAKRERRPFHVQDGIAAVPLYELAAACYKVGGDRAGATEAAGAAAALRQEIKDDYRTHRVRLDHALAIDDLQNARREVKILIQFTEGKPGDYVTWLTSMERSLRLKLGRPNT